MCTRGHEIHVSIGQHEHEAGCKNQNLGNVVHIHGMKTSLPAYATMTVFVSVSHENRKATQIVSTHACHELSEELPTLFPC